MPDRSNPTDGGPHYGRIKQAWVLLSHDRRAHIAGTVLIVAGVIGTVYAFLSRADIVDQPPGPCWPSVEASPRQPEPGNSVTVSSSGFDCGYLANDGSPAEYWLVITSTLEGSQPLRFGPIVPARTGAFTYRFTLPESTERGEWSVTIEGHQQYILPKGCKTCAPPDINPGLTVV